MIVNNLRKILRERGWSVYRFHQEARLHSPKPNHPHYRTINTLVKHEKKEISFELLDIICATLKCQVGDLYSYKPARPAAISKKAAKRSARALK